MLSNRLNGQLTKNEVSRSSAVMMIVVGLFFAGFGASMGWKGVTYAVNLCLARDWPAVPVTMESLRLDRSGSNSDGDSITIRTLCKYAYDFRGAHYSGTRVGLDDTPDNLSGWHERVFARLRDAEKTGQPIYAHVNPDDPSTAILDRETRLALFGFEAVFLVSFMAAGLGLMWGGKRSLEKARLRRSPTESFGSCEAPLDLSFSDGGPAQLPSDGAVPRKAMRRQRSSSTEAAPSRAHELRRIAGAIQVIAAVDRGAPASVRSEENPYESAHREPSHPMDAD